MLRLLFFAAVTAVAVYAETMLWKVSYGGHTLYLGGTVHMLRPADYPLPSAFDGAFAASDTLVLETDLGAMASPGFAAVLQQYLMYAPGKSLKGALDGRTYGALERYAQRQGVPMALLDRMKPPLAVMTLLQLQLQSLGVTAPGVDAYFFEKAQKEAKRVAWLESPEEQVAILASIGRKDPDAMVRQSLEEAGTYGTVMAQMIAMWRKGDAAEMERLGKKYLAYDDPEDYRVLIVRRNRSWMTKLQAMLRSPETELVLVGALHLVGPEGLVQRLRRKGYRVEQMP